MKFIFGLICPALTSLPKINLNNIRYSHNPSLFPHNNLTHLQALLKELLQLQMVIKLVKYFLQGILEYEGKEHKQMLVGDKVYDVINHLEKPFITKKVLFSNGSAIYNNTSIFSNRFDPMYLQDLLQLNNDCIFKLGATTSIVTIEFLMLLSYIYENVELVKSDDDTPFRDTFYAICTGIDIEKRKKLTNFMTNNVKELLKTNSNVTSIFEKDLQTCEQFNLFLYTIRPFIMKLHIVTVYHISQLRKAISTDKKSQGRINPIWKSLDEIVASKHFSISAINKILVQQDIPIFQNMN